jgi:rod shape determining protein RodA
MQIKKIDYFILFISFLIFIFGILNLYSATYMLSRIFVYKQILWFFFSILVGFLIYKIGLFRLIHYSYILYIVGILLLIFTLFSPSHSHVHSWLRIGPINIQTSQLMKVILPLSIVNLVSYKELKSPFSLFPSVLFFLIPFILILRQPDLGGAFLLFPAVVTIILVKRPPLRIILPWIILALIIFPIGYKNLQGYQKERLLVFLNPNLDPLGAGYTLTQSKIAIGSGRLLGKGWLRGAQGQLKFLPESHTDFVFPVFAEEWGFIGAGILLFLYFLLMYRLYKIGSRIGDKTSKLVLYAYFITLFSQIAINFSMTMGIFPIVGLPLPFFSYGGSDLVVTTWILAIFLDAERNLPH